MGDGREIPKLSNIPRPRERALQSLNITLYPVYLLFYYRFSKLKLFFQRRKQELGDSFNFLARDHTAQKNKWGWVECDNPFFFFSVFKNFIQCI